MSRRDRRRYFGKAPRRLRLAEVVEIFDGADKREATPPPSPLDVVQRRDYLKAKNPMRWRRMTADFRWAQKQLLQIGIDPEDVRWLL